MPFQACFERAAVKYNIDLSLLLGIAKTESNFKPEALHRNTNGTQDIGVMQINTQWLPKLQSFGIARDNLLEPCTNIDVAAWILAHNFATHGHTLTALGAYNAGFKDQPALNKIRTQYAVKVLMHSLEHDH